ncbi:type IV secretion system protein [Sphingomonas sp. 3-13AW]|uniref:type IV secretion system protein n=1 Tax=Sphingomonas sp. 3-13AW TaxID=3050450 RepID=UPI003BB7C62C
MNKLVAGAVALLAATAFTTPANAGGIPVIDPGNIAQTMKVVQQGVQQLKALQEQLKQVQGIQGTLGDAINVKKFSGDLFKLPGLSFDGPTSALAGLKGTLPGMLDALPSSNVGKDLGISPALASEAKTNIESGRKFAIQAFYKSGNATMNDISARSGVRQAALRDSATSGYALAVYAKNDLNGVEQTMNELSKKVAASTDLRSDVAANTAVELAALRQTAVTNQLLAQLLEVHSASAINSDSASVGVR